MTLKRILNFDDFLLKGLGGLDSILSILISHDSQIYGNLTDEWEDFIYSLKEYQGNKSFVKVEDYVYQVKDNKLFCGKISLTNKK